MTVINTTTGKSYNFKAPDADLGDSTKNEVPFPMYDVQDIADAAEIDIEANAQTTVVNVDELGAAITINVIAAADLVPGAVLIVVLPCGATARDASFDEGCVAGTVTGEANTTKKAVLIYDGEEFIPVGAAFDAVA